MCFFVCVGRGGGGRCGDCCETGDPRIEQASVPILVFVIDAIYFLSFYTAFTCCLNCFLKQTCLKQIEWDVGKIHRSDLGSRVDG